MRVTFVLHFCCRETNCGCDTKRLSVSQKLHPLFHWEIRTYQNTTKNYWDSHSDWNGYRFDFQCVLEHTSMTCGHWMQLKANSIFPRFNWNPKYCQQLSKNPQIWMSSPSFDLFENDFLFFFSWSIQINWWNFNFIMIDDHWSSLIFIVDHNQPWNWCHYRERCKFSFEISSLNMMILWIDSN